jgi:hypothetical protein
MATNASKIDVGTVNVCIKRVCYDCRKGDDPIRQSDGSWLHMMMGFEDRTEFCRAEPLHQLL